MSSKLNMLLRLLREVCITTLSHCNSLSITRYLCRRRKGQRYRSTGMRETIGNEIARYSNYPFKDMSSRHTRRPSFCWSQRRCTDSRGSRASRSPVPSPHCRGSCLDRLYYKICGRSTTTVHASWWCQTFRDQHIDHRI
jgi:hypothetical protein